MCACLLCACQPTCLCAPFSHVRNSDLMSGGRTSLLYANLVQAGRALSAQAVSAYPADRHPNVFFAYAVPTRDGSLPTLARAVREQALRVADGSAVDARTLERVKKVRDLGETDGFVLQRLSCWIGQPCGFAQRAEEQQQYGERAVCVHGSAWVVAWSGGGAAVGGGHASGDAAGHC